MNPYSRILVGFDGSARSADAARQGMELALQHRASLILAHVSSTVDDLTGVPDVVARAYSRLLSHRRVADRQHLTTLRTQLAGRGVEVSQLVADGFADTRLAELAHEHRADLIVVGSHGRLGLRRLALGSVAEKTVRFADCSVLVVRGEPVGGGFRRIVVGTDFSPISNPVVDRAFGVAAPDAVLNVVHAWHVPTSHAGEVLDEDNTAFVRRELAAWSQERGAALLAARASPAVRLGFRSTEGRAPDILREAASLDDADLVVIGSHGFRGVRLFVLGSVSEEVVRHAPCSVLVAR